MESVNEHSGIIISMSFYDASENAVSPSQLTYSLVDAASGEVIIGPTVVNLSSSTYDLFIDGSNLMIINNKLLYETKILNIDFIYASTIHGVSQFKFNLKNLFIQKQKVIRVQGGIIAGGIAANSLTITGTGSIYSGSMGGPY